MREGARDAAPRVDVHQTVRVAVHGEEKVQRDVARARRHDMAVVIEFQVETALGSRKIDAQEVAVAVQAEQLLARSNADLDVDGPRARARGHDRRHSGSRRGRGLSRCRRLRGHHARDPEPGRDLPLPVVDVVRVAKGAQGAAEEAVLAGWYVLAVREDVLGTGVDAARVAGVVLDGEGDDGAGEALGNGEDGAADFVLARDCWVRPVGLVPVAVDELAVVNF